MYTFLTYIFVYRTEGRNLVRCIRQMRALDQTVIIKHVYKKANRVADDLTALGCSLWEDNPCVLFNTPPDSVKQCVFYNSVKQYVVVDVIGVHTSRVISV